jgi:PIN domain nuclease of toxin-antitoxin system
MKYLIDSHVFLWALLKPSELSRKVTTILNDSSNAIYVSAVSYFELSLKYSLGKLDLENFVPEDLMNEANRIGFLELPLTAEDAAGLYQLDFKEHKDPFDKMLLWQAVRNKLKFVSRDSRVSVYSNYGLEIIW